MHPGYIILIVVGSIFGLLTLLNMKRSRSDGRFIKRLHPYRRAMFYIMRTRTESVVYFDTYVDADQLLAYVEAARQRFHVDVSHCLVGAGLIGLRENPKMDRFVSGRRLYQRKQTEISFSMKRKKLDREAKLAVVKLGYQDGESFEDLCGRINGQIGTERSDKKTYADKELGLFALLPRPVMRFMFGLTVWLNYYNLLPAGFIKNDPLYTSLFIANLGSLKMGAGYHHLYEWGTCPLFMMVGKIEDRPVVRGGEIVVQKQLHIRFTYDERIDDGLNARFGIDAVKRVLEDPFGHFGCVAEDGSDRRPLHVDYGPEKKTESA